MKEIARQENKDLMLGILYELDKYCNQNEIKYFLSYGTLLGAIRHKGFIPWDDDLDVMIPVEDCKRLFEGYKSNTYEIINIDRDINYHLPFMRMVDKRTVSYSHGYTYHGVFIDIYPIQGYVGKETNNKEYKMLKKCWRKEMFVNKMINIAIHFELRLLTSAFHQLRKNILKQEMSLLYKHDTKGCSQVTNGADKVAVIRPYPSEWIEDIIKVPFETGYFNAPREYDKWLSFFYGDYMQLPPEEKRVPYHGHIFFWK